MFSIDPIKGTMIALILALAVYTYYSLIVVPQNEIERLEKVVEKQRKIPVKIVNRINASDANRTQKEINNVNIDKNITFIDSGVIIF